MSAQIALNVDCMEYMRMLPDKAFDLAIVDPPYFTGPERRGYYGCKVSPIGVKRDYPISPKWDVPGVDYFSELVRVAKKYIVWGCNYFDVVFPRGVLSGTNAMMPVHFQTASWLLQIAMTV